MTFNELYAIFAERRKWLVKIGTNGTYLSRWRSVAPLVGERPAEEFTMADADAVKRALLARGMQASTVKNRLNLLRVLLKFGASELGLDVVPPVWPLRWPVEPPHTVRCYDSTELTRLVAVLLDELAQGRQAGALPALVAVTAGLRIGEVCALRWSDIDLRRRTINVGATLVEIPFPEAGGIDEPAAQGGAAITPGDGAPARRLAIVPPKTRSGYRVIPLVGLLAKVLRRLDAQRRRKQTSDPADFLLSGTEQPREPRSVSRSFARLLERRGLPELNFHGLRHTYATHLVDSGGDIKTISAILGHADVTTTMNLYVHPSLDSRRRVASRAFSRLSRAKVRIK